MVVDASVTLSWYFEDERTTASDAVLDRVAESGALVPSLWKLEVANGLQTAIRRKRINQAYRDDAIRRLTVMAIKLDLDTEKNVWTATPKLADRFDLTIYDATYLELAQRRGLPLASLDRALLRARPPA